MYIAEIHCKFAPHEERKEDILTSNVFSFFKYAKRNIFLYKLLKLLGLNITTHDANWGLHYFYCGRDQQNRT
jgi:hypothetical protein